MALDTSPNPTPATTQATPGLRHQVGQALAWNAVFTPLKFIIDTFATIIRLRFLHPAEVGVLALLSSAANSAGVFTDLGIDATLPKFMPEVEHQQGRGAAWRFLTTVIRLKLVVLGIGLALLPVWSGRLLHKMQQDVQTLAANPRLDGVAAQQVAGLATQLTRYTWLFVGAVAILVIFGSLFDTLRTYLTSFFRQKAWNVITAGATILLPILSVIAVFAGWGVLGVLFAMIMVPIISVVVTGAFVRRVARNNAPVEASQAIPRRTWGRFGLLALVTLLITSTDYLASQYFVTFWLGGPEKVAVFWVAYSFVKQIQSYAYTPLVGIQIPMFTRVRAEHDARLPDVFNLLNRILLVLFVPLALGLLLVMPNLILVQYPTYQAAIVPALILVVFLCLEPFWGVPQNILIVHEDYRNLVWTRCIALSSIPLLVFLTPRLGILGAVWAIGLSRAATGVAAITVVARKHGLRLPWRFAQKIGLVSGGMVLCLLPLVLWLGTSPAGEHVAVATRLAYAGGVLGIGIVGMGMFVVLARYFKLLEPADRELLRTLRSPLVRRVERWL